LRLAGSRTDFVHKLSGAIAKSYSVVVLEDLNIQGMVKNKNLAKSILDAYGVHLGGCSNTKR
ncbi:MAG: hypothetical protein ACP5UI_03685, partial [Thermoprotei archaeon]